MSIRLTCGCGKSFSVPDGTEGRETFCPECKKTVRVPEAPDRDGQDSQDADRDAADDGGRARAPGSDAESAASLLRDAIAAFEDVYESEPGGDAEPHDVDRAGKSEGGEKAGGLDEIEEAEDIEEADKDDKDDKDDKADKADKEDKVDKVDEADEADEVEEPAREEAPGGAPDEGPVEAPDEAAGTRGGETPGRSRRDAEGADLTPGEAPDDEAPDGEAPDDEAVSSGSGAAGAPAARSDAGSPHDEGVPVEAAAVEVARAGEGGAPADEQADRGGSESSEGGEAGGMSADGGTKEGAGGGRGASPGKGRAAQGDHEDRKDRKGRKGRRRRPKTKDALPVEAALDMIERRDLERAILREGEPDSPGGAYDPEEVELHDGVIKFHCRCGKRISVPAKAKKTIGRCPKCSARIVIPKPSAAKPPGEKRRRASPEEQAAREDDRGRKARRAAAEVADRLRKGKATKKIALPEEEHRRSPALVARVVAFQADTAVLAAAFFGAFFLLRGVGLGEASLLSAVSFAAAVWFVNRIVMQSADGASFGMKVAGVILVGSDGRRTNPRKTALRALLGVLLLPLAPLAFTDDKRRTPADRAAGTAVVSRKA